MSMYSVIYRTGYEIPV